MTGGVSIFMPKALSIHGVQLSHYAVERRIRDRAELEGIEMRSVSAAYTSQECS